MIHCSLEKMLPIVSLSTPVRDLEILVSRPLTCEALVYCFSQLGCARKESGEKINGACLNNTSTTVINIECAWSSNDQFCKLTRT
jgi:hypothetical protein